MDVNVYIFAAAFVIILIIWIALVGGRGSESGEQQEDGDRQEVAPQRGAAENVGGVRRRVVVPRNRRMRRPDNSDDDDEEEEQEFEHVTLPTGKIGAKKMKKLQEKEERAKNREAELQGREERKKRHEELDKLSKKREEKEIAEEAVREAEEKAVKEQKEKEEYEEYLKLKEQFTVEDEGTDACALHEDTESLLQQFIGYIKDMKVVMLEDLAAHFKLKTQEVIDRIKELQDAGRLSGVLDDRGKFIYITQDEYEAVAKFIKQRGRVSISDLAQSSNTLINLTPDNQSTHAQLVSNVASL